MRSAKRMKTNGNGGYTYIGLDKPHCDRNCAACHGKMLEEEQFLLNEGKVLGELQYGETTYDQNRILAHMRQSMM